MVHVSAIGVAPARKARASARFQGQGPKRETAEEGPTVRPVVTRLAVNTSICTRTQRPGRVRSRNGALHVSLDVDFLDPSIAPAVGTTVPGGATEREAHLAMELLHESGLVCSLDLVELNPFLDERGRTTKLMVDLAASLMGRRIFDRPTRSF